MRWLMSLCVASIAVSWVLASPPLLFAAVDDEDDRVYNVGRDIKAPKLVYRIEPEYTDSARDANINGTVVLGLEVSKAGKAENIRIIRSLEDSLDQSAIRALQKWRFEPATKSDGTPVRVKSVIEFHFRRL
jgi:TonB family protein